MLFFIYSLLYVWKGVKVSILVDEVVFYIFIYEMGGKVKFIIY